MAVPGLPPVITPEDEFILAIVVLLLLHMPPVTASLNVITDPAEQTEEGPAIATGDGLTVTVVVEKQPGPVV